MSDYLFELPPPPCSELTAEERERMQRAGCDAAMLEAASRFQSHERAQVIAFMVDYAERGKRILGEMHRAAEFLAVAPLNGFGSKWLRIVCKMALLTESVTSGCPLESLANTSVPTFYASLTKITESAKIAARIRCNASLPEILWAIWKPSPLGGPRHD
jgi:hypothetical protein